MTHSGLLVPHPGPGSPRRACTPLLSRFDKPRAFSLLGQGCPTGSDECPRPSIKWFAKLKEKTAAERCDKWLADAEAGFQEAFTS